VSTTAPPAEATAAGAPVRAGEVVRPTWRRLRPWLALGVVVVVAGFVVAALSTRPGRPLDPDSAHKNGSKALAVLLGDHGTHVVRTASLASATRAAADVTVLVASPNSYSARQLRSLSRDVGRLVLAGPSVSALAAVTPDVVAIDEVHGRTEPGCTAPGADVAGTVDLPAAVAYRSTVGTACYDGAVVFAPRLVVLGSADLLRNDTLAHDGVAALDVNSISDNGAARRVLWLLPSTEATGRGAPSIWQLFPAGAHRAFGWLFVVAMLLVLWQGRRLGPAVTEPLPVVVRAAEVVEGHGRLYRRAGARDRAAAALRAAALTRLAVHAGTQRAGFDEVVAAVAAATRRPAAEVGQLLGGPAPSDDAALVRLATELDALEAAAGVPPRGKGLHL
jgi:hypothetical protein